MQKKHWSLILAMAMLLSLFPQAVLAQAPNYYTSVIVSDVTSGAPLWGKFHDRREPLGSSTMQRRCWA